jgi:hypothetical protein
MEQHQKLEDNSPVIQKKKIYNKPVLTVLGKVAELTTGGSGRRSECHWGDDDGAQQYNNGRHKNRC